MKLSAELVQELEVLSLFPREGTQMGLKFHHDAGPPNISLLPNACSRSSSSH